MKLLYLAMIAIITVLFVFCLSSNASAAQVSGYTFVKAHNVTGSPDGALTGYTIKFVVHNGSGTDSGQDVYLNGHAQSWPNDIRFTNSTDGLLSYWIESYDANTATVWVKVASLPASPGTALLKLYYGKAGDSGASSGDATFSFFDNFPGSALNTSKWTTTISGSSTITVSGNTLHLYAPSNTRAAITSSYATSGGIRLEAQLKMLTASQPRDRFNTVQGMSGDAGCFNSLQWFWNGAYTGVSAVSDSYGRLTETLLPGTSYRFQFSQNNFDRTVSPTTTTSINPWFQAGDPSICTGDITLAWVFVRQYTSNEPAHGTWGSETPVSQPVTSYSYVKSHNINGTTDGSLCNYQVKFVVHSGNGTDSGQDVYLNGHSQSWPNDLRFTDSAGVSLPSLLDRILTMPARQQSGYASRIFLPHRARPQYWFTTAVPGTLVRATAPPRSSSTTILTPGASMQASG